MYKSICAHKWIWNIEIILDYQPHPTVKRPRHFLLRIGLWKWTGERENKREWKEKRKRCGITWLYCEVCVVCSTSSVLTKHVCKGIPRFCGEHYFEAFHFTKMECVRKPMVIACQEWDAWLKCCPLLLTGRNWGTFWDGEGSGNYSNHQRQTAGVSITPKAVMHSNSHVMTPGSL